MSLQKCIVHLHTPFGEWIGADDGKGVSDLFNLPEDLCGLGAEALPEDYLSAMLHCRTWRWQDTPLLRQLAEELSAYFGGQLKDFTVPLSLRGTDFQRQVWEALRTIPYGQTCSYGDIAALLGKPRAVRAVGGANHANPVMLIVPCHRVIGKDGSLTGYGGGLPLKEALLRLERGAGGQQ